MVKPYSYDCGDLHQPVQCMSAGESVTQRLWSALPSSVQGSLAIFYIFTFVSTGSWSVLHQWAGYTIVLLSLVLWVVLKLNKRFGTVSSARSFKSAIKHSRWLLLLRVQRITGIMLMTFIGIAAMSGWMYTLDFFWGLVWIEKVHSVTAYAATALLILYSVVFLYVKLSNLWSDSNRW